MQVKKHIVASGDTLSSIITKYYGSCDDNKIKMVKEANKIEDINKISVGMSIDLPGNWGIEIDKTHMTEKPEEITKLTNKTQMSDNPTTKTLRISKSDLPVGDYWNQVFPKELIVLHFTAGYSAQAAINTFKGPGRVATPYVIDIDGTIYQLYSSDVWAYHLGIPGKLNDNYYWEKHSVGIEIVNIGPIWKRNDGMYKDYVGRSYKKEQIIEGKIRDADGGVIFPEIQMRSVIDLVEHLIVKYNIPRQIPKDKLSYQLPKMKGFKGVITHSMVRNDKYDTGVALPYEKLITGCNLKEIEL